MRVRGESTYFTGKKPHLGCDTWMGQCHSGADTSVWPHVANTDHWTPKATGSG